TTPLYSLTLHAALPIFVDRDVHVLPARPAVPGDLEIPEALAAAGHQAPEFLGVDVDEVAGGRPLVAARGRRRRVQIAAPAEPQRSEEHTSELQSRFDLV